MRNLVKTRLIAAVVAILSCTPFPSGLDSGHLGDVRLVDSSYIDAAHCDCFSLEEMQAQILELACSPGIIHWSCKENPKEFLVENISVLCYRFEQSTNTCLEPVREERCFDCCNYSRTELFDDYITTCMNESITIYPLFNDVVDVEVGRMFECIDNATNGSVSSATDFACVYAPDADFIGTDTFDYYFDGWCAGTAGRSSVHVEIVSCADAG